MQTIPYNFSFHVDAPNGNSSLISKKKRKKKEENQTNKRTKIAQSFNNECVICNMWGFFSIFKPRLDSGKS